MSVSETGSAAQPAGNEPPCLLLVIFSEGLKKMCHLLSATGFLVSACWFHVECARNISVNIYIIGDQPKVLDVMKIISDQMYIFESSHKRGFMFDSCQ